MSQLQESIRAMLPDDPRQALLPNQIPLNGKHPKQINLCLERMRSAGLVSRAVKVVPGKGRLWAYWRII